MQVRRQSEVARRFLNNPIPKQLGPGTIPEIGERAIRSLAMVGITSPDQLVGHFFLQDRDEKLFWEYLEDVGIPSIPARKLAEVFRQKFGEL